MVSIYRKCKYCSIEETIDTNKDFLYIECCSDECKEHYHKATGTSFNPIGEHIFYNGVNSLRELVAEYKKRLDR